MHLCATAWDTRDPRVLSCIQATQIYWNDDCFHSSEWIDDWIQLSGEIWRQTPFYGQFFLFSKQHKSISHNNPRNICKQVFNIRNCWPFTQLKDCLHFSPLPNVWHRYLHCAEAFLNGSADIVGSKQKCFRFVQVRQQCLVLVRDSCFKFAIGPNRVVLMPVIKQVFEIVCYVIAKVVCSYYATETII